MYVFFGRSFVLSMEQALSTKCRYRCLDQARTFNQYWWSAGTASLFSCTIACSHTAFGKCPVAACARTRLWLKSLRSDNNGKSYD